MPDLALANKELIPKISKESPNILKPHFDNVGTHSATVIISVCVAPDGIAFDMFDLIPWVNGMTLLCADRNTQVYTPGTVET